MVFVKELMPGACDEANFEYALAHGYTLITFDTDYGEIAQTHGAPHPCIVRLIEDQPIAEVLNSLRQIFEHQPNTLATNALIVVAKDHFRLRMTWHKEGDQPQR